MESKPYRITESFKQKQEPKLSRKQLRAIKRHLSIKGKNKVRPVIPRAREW